MKQSWEELSGDGEEEEEEGSVSINKCLFQFCYTLALVVQVKENWDDEDYEGAGPTGERPGAHTQQVSVEERETVAAGQEEREGGEGGEGSSEEESSESDSEEEEEELTAYEKAERRILV